MIDLDVMPPDWKFAQQHANAMRPGIIPSFYIKHATHIYCQCCLKPVQKQPVPLSANSKQLQFLGFGFPLYFIYFKYSIILVTILVFSYSGISLYWAITSNENFCTHRLLATSTEGDPHCTSFLIIFARTQSQLSEQEMILRISSFVLQLLALMYIRDNIRKKYEYFDERAKSLSHYSLVLKNLPLKNSIQQNIKDFINKHFQQQWLKLQEQFDDEHFNHKAQKVKQIILVPNLKEYLKLQKQNKQLIQKKRKLFKQQKNQQCQQQQYFPQTINVIPSIKCDDINLSTINGEIKVKKQDIIKMKKKLLEKAILDQLQAQMAIVVLNTELFKNTVLNAANKRKRFDKNLLEKYFGQLKSSIKIIQAPQPNEIIWQNIQYSPHQRLVGRLMGWGFSVVFLAAVTVAFYFILVLKSDVLLQAIQQSITTQQYHDSGAYRAAQFLVFLVMFLTVIFNKLVMSWVLHHFTFLQKHQNTSQEEFSFCLKYTLGLFFTTAVMTFAVEALTFDNFYTHQYGVIQEQSIMFFVNALFVPLFMLLNPFQLKVLLVRKFRMGKKYFTQRQANKIMSDYPYSMGKQYAQIIESLWFTFLYASVVPLGAFIMVVGLGLYYWTSKFNLLRRSSLRHNISAEIVLNCLKLLDITLIMRPLGEIIFDASIRDGVNLSSIIMLAIAIIYFFLPMGKIINFFNEQKFRHSKKTYDEVKSRFVQTYETLHPILNYRILQVFRRFQRSTSKKITLTNISIPGAVDELITDGLREVIKSRGILKRNGKNWDDNNFNTQYQMNRDENKFNKGHKFYQQCSYRNQ